MRLSHSIQRRILETGVGFLLNKFRGKSRRNVLYFEDLCAQYVEICEKAGHSREIEDIAFRWGALTAKRFLPHILKKLPESVVFNVLLKSAWINIGVLKDLNISRKNNILKMETKSENITRLIGKNAFMPGFYAGMLSGILDARLESIKMHQTRENATYEFEVKDGPLVIEGKSKDIYNKLNLPLKSRGFTLEDALKTNRFQLKKDNKLYFRERPLVISENTMFHLLGNKGLLLDELPKISYSYFLELIEKDTTKKEKLVLLKSLLQTMGWGLIKIEVKGKRISIEVKSPPHGLQLERDNWNFLAQTILGYLWLLNKDLRFVNAKEMHRSLRLEYMAE